ncbi:MAG: response regulator [Planctomycetes bacterium]|nr:response regulator [Planctomycetota bacterium]
MTKRVLDVGNCVPDHASICSLVEGNFDAKVVQAHGSDDALDAIRNEQVDLVLVNRKLDRDNTDGLDIIKLIKADGNLNTVPCMLLTNYEDHQELAVEAGAEMGFGKLGFDAPETRERLKAILG